MRNPQTGSRISITSSDFSHDYSRGISPRICVNALRYRGFVGISSFAEASGVTVMTGTGD